GLFVYFFFFFQAEDGIRDYKVTGVQTCALPIYFSANSGQAHGPAVQVRPHQHSSGVVRRCWSIEPSFLKSAALTTTSSPIMRTRSEERRVGKECRSRW